MEGVGVGVGLRLGRGKGVRGLDPPAVEELDVVRALLEHE
jgi:hypothetical protein